VLREAYCFLVGNKNLNESKVLGFACCANRNNVVVTCGVNVEAVLPVSFGGCGFELNPEAGAIGSFDCEMIIACYLSQDWNSVVVDVFNGDGC